MSLNSLNRNYGMSSNSREFWGGNNGFVTVVVSVPAGTEIGVTAVAQDGSDAAQTALTAANYNQFKIVQALGQRAVVVAISQLTNAADPTGAGFATVGGNVLAYGAVGTQATASFAITFLVERANVLNTQTNKPGATYALTVNPTLDLATTIAQAAFFRKSDGTNAVASTGVAVKVYDALPAILA